MRTLKKVLTFNHESKMAEVHLYLDDQFTDIRIQLEPAKHDEDGEELPLSEEDFDETTSIILAELDKEFSITPMEREEFIGALNDGKFDIDESTTTTGINDITSKYEHND